MTTQSTAPSEKPPSEGRGAGIARQLAIATELPFVLVACVVVGGLLGAGIDRLLHTSPYGMLLFGAVGFFAGIRDILRRLGTGGKPGGSSDGTNLQGRR